MSSKLYATFVLDDILLGVEATMVQEVLAHQQLAQIQLAPPEVVGLMNLRGQVVVTLDLRGRLGMPAKAVDPSMVNVVLRTPSGAVSVLVDSVRDVLEVADHDLVVPPVTLSPHMARYVTAVHKLDGELLLLLDAVGVTEPMVLS